ncbi:MAG: hypothetical protein H5T59_02125 [Anaerolineae bacterium]|nr:hypothetical protein [Anaerolineae bacterium]
MVAYRRLAFVGVLVALAAGGGLVWVVTRYPPTGAAVPAFFLLAFLAVTGLACPAAVYLNYRFAGLGRGSDALRQSVWVGILATLGLWLQAMRVFTWTALVLLAAALLLAELFILRTRK